MEASSLVAIPGSRLPEMLGNFQLDNHHVEEWSDPALEPGQKHRARKEVGKWVNLEQNADIHFEKQEDSKHSDRSQERSRTEVIKGTAPDSSFQVVRSHRQYQDGDERSGSTMQQTSSTAYHVSSSRGVRSTTKTTSNKTTTKTVTVSGGGNRADEFENLRMSFTPLDTSTQRERISVSRSGTMGIRRPPTRRHTPAALLCSSPEDGPEAQRPDEGQILVDSDDNLRDTPDPDVGKMGEQAGMSIVGFKNISPKIRVGFPVEIQLELQTKLRSNSTLERENHRHHHHHHHLEENLMRDSADMDFDNKETDSNDRGIMETTIPIALADGLSSSVSSSRDSSFDYKERKKSSTLLTGNYEPVVVPPSKESQNGTLLANPFRSSLHQFNSRLRDDNEENVNGHCEMNGNARRMSWDLLQNMRQQTSDQNLKLYSTLSSGTSSGGEDYMPAHLIDDEDDDDEYDRNRRNSFTQQLRSINTNNNNNEDKKSVLHNSRETLINFTRQSSYEAQNDTFKNPGLEIEEVETTTNDLQSSYHRQHRYHQQLQDSQTMSTPDVLHHDNSNSSSLSPSLERSRKLLKMLDETPDLINKMSFRSYFSASASEKPESKDWDEDNEEKDDYADWETQRQLSFLNDSLSRILNESRSIDSITFKGDAKNDLYQNGNSTGEDSDALDMNGNFKEVGKTVQVSQTWISSVDHKPAQTVRDNDVVTSISATNDTYKKGPKKVEFCKTEVHFTPDSGRFNIVETDENKPSTVHLFRRKKRSERKSQQQQQQQQQNSTFSSSSSMSSLESTTEKSETAYIVEMEVGSETHEKAETTRESSKARKSEENTSTVQIEDVSNQEPNSLPMLASTFGKGSKSSVSEKSATHYERNDSSEGRCSRVFINLESIANNSNNHSNSDEYEDEVRSPSHMILSNYGEMKIQRYLKQLKSPSSREGSSSPVGSPTQQHGDGENDDHFRFDNILYENGSFVPMATRRSLIEMNNRNRKRINASASQSSDNSSTTSTYSLPTSDKDQYSTLRMGSMEAIVSTDGPRPQITSVDFRYKHDNDNGMDHAQSEEDAAERLDRMTSDVEYHNLSVKERRERFSSVPSPVMPNLYGTGKSGKSALRHSAVISPIESHASDISNRPSSSTYLSKKPPTPILPMQFATFEKTGAELRGRFYAKANNTNMSTASELSNDTMQTATLSSVKKGEGKTKSIVTIGSYNEAHEHVDEVNSREMTVTTTTMDEPLDSDGPGLEPVLSLDHTWKGPAHYENSQQEELLAAQSKATTIGAKSLTFPKFLRSEPEWVSKAKSRETRVTDWSLIEKQQTATATRNTEPPWISEIRFRNKPTPNEELKSLPKISVVYPWQRDNSSKESSAERQDPNEESHIVSIIPEPSVNGTVPRDDKRFGSYDLYSGKSLPPIKSLKSVPEVSIPASRKNKSIVEVHSEPEHYISTPPKHYSQSKKKVEVYPEGFELATMSKSSSSSSHKSSSMRVTNDTSSTTVAMNEHKREAETFPKKSRKPLQITQQNKEKTLRGGHSQKHEEKYKTQPKPPRPPTRGTSLPREEATHHHGRDSNLLAVAPIRQPSRADRPSQKERTSDTSVTGHTTTSRKTSSRRKATEMTHMSAASPQQRETSQQQQPVHHRHPTIQITKLPMRTAKVSVVDGKRVSSGNNSSSNKSKSKHHVVTTVKGENRDPKATVSTPGSSPTRDGHGRHGQPKVQNGGIMQSKPRRSCQQTPLKTSTRSPSLELETKKRKTNAGDQDLAKGTGKRK